MLCFAFVKYMRWGIAASGMTSPLPSLKHVAVSLDKGIYMTPRPQKEVYGTERLARGIFKTPRKYRRMN
jgi:hypothetical protein